MVYVDVENDSKVNYLERPDFYHHEGITSIRLLEVSSHLEHIAGRERIDGYVGYLYRYFSQKQITSIVHR
jgi:hypothetical protein